MSHPYSPPIARPATIPTGDRGRPGPGDDALLGMSATSSDPLAPRRGTERSTQPASQPSAAHTDDDETQLETWSDRINAALPLFTVGGLCISIAFTLYTTGSATGSVGSGTVRLQLWTLFVALGITGFASGTFALLAEGVPQGSVRAPSKMTAPPKRQPLDRRARRPFESGSPNRSGSAPTARTSVATAPPAVLAVPSASRSRSSASPPPVPPPWDESVVEREEPPAGGDEVWDLNSPAFRAAAFDSSSPDVILRQLEELEKSLKKKSGARR
jgi:hypothetical protein